MIKVKISAVLTGNERTADKQMSTNLNGTLKQHCNNYMTKTAQQESTKVKLLNDGVHFHTLLLHFALVLQVNCVGWYQRTQEN